MKPKMSRGLAAFRVNAGTNRHLQLGSNSQAVLVQERLRLDVVLISGGDAFPLCSGQLQLGLQPKNAAHCLTPEQMPG